MDTNSNTAHGSTPLDDEDNNADAGTDILPVEKSPDLRSAAEIVHNAHGNTKESLATLAVGLFENNKPLLDYDDYPFEKIPRREIKPTQHHLKDEVVRRAALRRINGVRPASWSRADCIKWLNKYPVQENADVEFIKKSVTELKQQYDTKRKRDDKVTNDISTMSVSQALGPRKKNPVLLAPYPLPLRPFERYPLPPRLFTQFPLQTTVAPKANTFQESDHSSSDKNRSKESEVAEPAINAARKANETQESVSVCSQKESSDKAAMPSETAGDGEKVNIPEETSSKSQNHVHVQLDLLQKEHKWREQAHIETMRERKFKEWSDIQVQIRLLRQDIIEARKINDDFQTELMEDMKMLVQRKNEIADFLGMKKSGQDMEKFLV